MSELEGILGIKFPKGIKISHATNDSKKVKKDSILNLSLWGLHYFFIFIGLTL